MGYFGTGISGNDQYLDTYNEFFSLYNKGNEPGEISAYLIESNQDLINDDSVPDSFSFWYALATAQWECKQLDPVVHIKVKHFVESNLDLQFWDESDKAKRRKSLGQLLEKISSEKEKAKPRKKTKPPLFKKGDCIVIRLCNGNYGGIVILEALFDEEKETSQNLAATTRINMPTKPILEDFSTAEVLITNFEFDNDRQAFQRISWIYQYQQNKVKGRLEIIGNIHVKYQYHPTKNYGFGTSSGAWFQDIMETVPKQYASEQTKTKYIHTKTIKELTENETWRFW